MTARFEIVACGVDDVTIGFDMSGSRSVARLNEMTGEPFGLRRLEAEQRYEPTEIELDEVVDSPFPSLMWKSRYGGLVGRVTRLGRESQTVALADRVAAGELTYAQGERPSRHCCFGISDDCVQESEHLLVAPLVSAITGEVLYGTPVPLRLDDRLTSWVEKLEQTF